MPPIVYLVRHADALDAEHDAIRPLSPRGHTEVRHLAALLRASSVIAPTEVWVSPLLRARETAELLVKELRLKPAWREYRELEPEADPAHIVPRIGAAKVPIALFGHEPHMSALASLLVTGAPSPIVFAFKKATMLALEPAGSRWTVQWQLSPDLFAS